MSECPICKYNKASLIESTENGFYIYKCLSCETCYSLPCNPTKVPKYDYINEKTHSRKEIEEVIKILEVIKQVKCDTGDNISVLEIGSGDFRHLIILRRMFPTIKLIGVDLAYEALIKEDSIKTILDKYNIEAINSLENLIINNHKFDLIYFFHVLGHIENPEEFLLKIRSLLKDDGYVMFSVPNPDRLSKKVFGNEEWDYPPYHFYRFSVKSINHLLEATNLQVITVKQYQLKLKYDFYIYKEKLRYIIFSKIKRLKDLITSNRRNYKNYSTVNHIDNGVYNQSVKISVKDFIKNFISPIYTSLGSILFFILYLYDLLYYKKGALSMAVIAKKRKEGKDNASYVVFDFDGTIINKDSFISYTNFLGKNSILMKIFIRFLQELYYSKIISNTLFKVLLWKMIPLKYKSDNFIRNFVLSCLTEKYHNREVISELMATQSKDILVISATHFMIVRSFFQIYYPDLLSNKGIKVFGSSYNSLCDKFFINNLRGKNKLKLLEFLGIGELELLYTDSIEEDRYLYNVSKKCKIVGDINEY
ncbi:MAG: methyltransferase domain-containing protein [candidate division WOR-3 bacterium]|nr:methyltransferase domain-containing protein [candidate division WOR-3 bacterium]